MPSDNFYFYFPAEASFPATLPKTLSLCSVIFHSNPYNASFVCSAKP